MTLLDRFGRHWLKPLAFWALAAPLIWLIWQWALWFMGQPNGLGVVNPIESTHRFLGDTALRILLISLAVTPFRDMTCWTPIMRIRRRIGLAAFWYAALHVTAYLGLDLFFSLARLWEDVVERVYITLGMGAFLLLIPLALTSFDGVIRRMGPKAWRRLHQLVYPLAILAVLHHGFMVKGVQLMPWIHGGILALLLGWRVLAATRRRARAAA
jgi:sulfoxide reductase heme-binding subunit YedZ